MLLDAKTTFGLAVAIPTSGTGTFNIGDIIDLSKEHDIANGFVPLWLWIAIDTSVDSAADNTTIQFRLVSDDSSTIPTDGSHDTTHFLSVVFAQAAVQAKAIPVNVRLQPGNYRRYLGLQVIVGTAAATAGAIDAAILAETQRDAIYPEAVS